MCWQLRDLRKAFECSKGEVVQGEGMGCVDQLGALTQICNKLQKCLSLISHSDFYTPLPHHPAPSLSTATTQVHTFPRGKPSLKVLAGNCSCHMSSSRDRFLKLQLKLINSLISKICFKSISSLDPRFLYTQILSA